MKLLINTEIFPILNVGLYGTTLGDFFEDVSEEYVDDFKDTVVSYGIDYINQILANELVGIKNVKATNGEFKSPQWYNYHNNTIEFDLEVPDVYLNLLKGNEQLMNNKLFFEWAEKNFGSHPGFISFYPTTPEKFKMDINGIHPELAICMWLMWMMDRDSLESYQRDFEDNVFEEGNKNGWYDYEE